MRITLISIGSRGDIQPFVALGAGLKAAGYDVRLATHEEFRAFAVAYGLDFAPLAGDPRALLESEEGKKWLESSRNPVAFFRHWREMAAPLIEAMAVDTLRAAEGTDLIIASTLGLLFVTTLQELKGIPYIAAPLQPLYQTRSAPSAPFPELPAGMPLRGTYNNLTYSLSRQLMWRLFGSIVNDARQTVFKLERFMLEDWLPKKPTLPVLHGYSRHVIPQPPDWPANAHITGYWFLDTSADFAPPPSLVEFLKAGPPPVYVGFGSMKNREAKVTTKLVLKALELSGQRGVLLTGWGGLSNADLPDTVYRVESIPHDWLFPHMAAVVHHGGAGTTAAGLRAGVPSVLVPFFADQPFWANRVYELGVGPKPVLRKRLTAEKLASAIRIAVTDHAIQDRAAALGKRIRAEDGIANFIDTLEREMPHLVPQAEESMQALPVA